MAEQGATQSQGQAGTEQLPSPWAPSVYTTDMATGKPIQSPTSFEQAASRTADSVAKDLGIDTSNQEIQREVQQTKEEAIDDIELEVQPNKRMKRSEVSKKLKEHEQLLAKQKQFERESYTRMQQAAEQKKQSDAQMQQAQRALQVEARVRQIAESGDLGMLLREFGHDPDKVRDEVIQRAYADAQKTPEQRQIDQLMQERAQLQQYRQQEQARQQQEHQRQQMSVKEQENQRAAQNFQQAFTQTAQKMGLPQTPLTTQRFANTLISAQQRGLDPTFEQLGNAVSAQYAEDMIQFVDTLTPERFTKLPSKTKDRLRKFFLSATGAAPTSQERVQSSRPRQDKPMTTRSYTDYVQQLNNKRS